MRALLPLGLLAGLCSVASAAPDPVETALKAAKKLNKLVLVSIHQDA